MKTSSKTSSKPVLKRVITGALFALMLSASTVYVNPASADLARSGSTVLVSAFPDGTPADGGEPSVSADGRYVAFSSWDKLLPDARDSCQSVYRKDMVTGELLLLAPGTCSTFTPSISADGNKVLYIAGGCIRGIPINFCSGYRAYVRDIAAGTTVTVSDISRSVEYAKLSSDGNYAVLLHSDGWDVWGAQVRDVNNPSNVWHIGSIGLSVPDYTADTSADGRYVAFEAESKHVPQDGDSDADVYLFDRLTGVITLVGIHPSGEARYSRNPSISADGRAITFASTEVPTSPEYGPVHLLDNVYIRDLASGTTSLASQSSFGQPAMEGSLKSSISGDGRLVAFSTFAPLSIDTNPESDIFMRNISSGKTSLLSILPDGTQGYGFRGLSDFADGGRFVAFESILQPDYLPLDRRVYLRDLQPLCSLAVCPLDYP